MSYSYTLRRYVITGSQRASNYWWALVTSFGGLAFLLTGFASFLDVSLFTLNESKTIAFFPQGLTMCFYGSLGLLFGIYLWCTIFWGVGNGFNEFNGEQGIIRIFRWGLPGKGRRIDLLYKIEQVEGVRLELRRLCQFPPYNIFKVQIKSGCGDPLFTQRSILFARERKKSAFKSRYSLNTYRATYRVRGH